MKDEKNATGENPFQWQQIMVRGKVVKDEKE